MRNLLVKQKTQSPLHHQLGIYSVEISARMLGLALGFDRKRRYEKMVKSVYGEPDAANRLLLKTLCLSAMDESNET